MADFGLGSSWLHHPYEQDNLNKENQTRTK